MNMVHKYSPEALARRRERALSLKFFAPKPAGHQHVCILEPLAPRVRTISRSLELHLKHNEFIGHVTHFARTAALAASEQQLIPKEHPALRIVRSIRGGSSPSRYPKCPEIQSSTTTLGRGSLYVPQFIVLIAAAATS